MKLIAHRGNIDGPNLLNENNPEHIDNIILQGYDVEIDIRFDDDTKQFFLGHDYSKYLVNLSWLHKHKENLWIHCKNVEALYQFSSNLDDYNYFWHEQDSYTMTSKKYIWSYPGEKYNSKSIIVMPELNLFEFINCGYIVMKHYNCFGICSDYVGKIK